MPITEARIAQINDLKDGAMKQVTVGETDVLLVRIQGHYHAFYAYCTHYGAPLAEGVISDDRLVCPWHHACFQMPSGDHCEPPGLDSLPRFEVRIDGDDVMVYVPEAPETARIQPMAGRQPADDRVFVVLGAGAAGAYAVEAMREAGFTGRLVLITQENDLPYDRPNCSKDYLQGEAEDDWMMLRSRSFYDDLGVELMTGQRVAKVDAKSKTVRFTSNAVINFDTLVVCTGGVPRQLDVPGAQLDGVFTLRSYADSRALHEAAQNAVKAVVIGASFIGLEVAFSLRKLNLDVAVVAPEATPFEPILGEQVGRMIQDEHEQHGVRFYLASEVEALQGDEAVSGVVLKDGTRLDADLVVIGIGVAPATEILDGVSLADDGSVPVDEHLRAAEGLYAAGDVAQFPDWRTGERIRIEHWQLACLHGRLAGYHAAGREAAYRSVPFFWSEHFDIRLRYVGYVKDWDEIIYDGDPQQRAFIAYYVKDGQTRAAAGVNRDHDMAVVHELLRRERMPDIEILRQGGVDLMPFL